MIVLRAKGAVLMLAALTLIACNLTRNLPTPTAIPATIVPMQPPSLLTPFGTPIPPNPNCGATPLGWIPYVVEQGDTYSLLALQTSSTIADLIAGNCKGDADSLIQGETIYVPRQPVVSQ